MLNGIKIYVQASAYNVKQMVDKDLGNFTIVFKKITRNGHKFPFMSCKFWKSVSSDTAVLNGPNSFWVIFWNSGRCLLVGPSKRLKKLGEIHI